SDARVGGNRTGNANGRPFGQPAAIIARGPLALSCHHDRVTPRRSLGAGAVALVFLFGAFAAPSAVLAHGAVPPDPPSFANVLFGGESEPLIAGALLVAALGWLWIVRRVARLHPGNGVSAWRSAAFFGGLFAIAFALMSGIERYDTTLFSLHMVQHLLLMLVA